MKYDELDARMRVFETAHDHCVLPGVHMVVPRRAVVHAPHEEVHAFETPFDVRVRELMVHTTKHLMECGFRVLYGFTESDEISLLLHRDEDLFHRKLRKLQSILAGEASAAFSLALGAHGVFDARVSQLPDAARVRDYFRWRQEDAHRNALNAHCYWALRREGRSVAEATSVPLGMATADKHELLFRHGVNYNDVPAWQKRGVGVYATDVVKEGLDPRTGTPTRTTRRRLHVDLDLPYGDALRPFIDARLRTATAADRVGGAGEAGRDRRNPRGRSRAWVREARAKHQPRTIDPIMEEKRRRLSRPSGVASTRVSAEGAPATGRRQGADALENSRRPAAISKRCGPLTWSARRLLALLPLIVAFATGYRWPRRSSWCS
jgi:tRNA(His) 5'-end guanylyltransferase